MGGVSCPETRKISHVGRVTDKNHQRMDIAARHGEQGWGGAPVIFPKYP